MSSLEKKAISGTLWTIVGFGGSQMLRLGANLIVTRLLAPELFGLMALVQTFLTGLSLFSDIGIRPSLIRSKRADDPIFVNTAWTLQVIRGVVIYLLCLSLTVPVARFYDEPRLYWLIPLISINSIFSGFNSTALVTLSRNLQVGKLTRFEFLLQMSSITVMIIWAWIYPNIGALVCASITATLLRTIGSYKLAPHSSNYFTWETEAFEELISFGRWILLSTAISFLAVQTDRLILGKLIPFEILGVYAIAYMFADLPRNVINKVSSQVIFPVIAEKKHLPRKELRHQILRKRWLLLLGLGLMICLFACFGDQLILRLYDARYKQASWMLPILALGIWPNILVSTIDRALYVIGKPAYNTIGNALKFIYMLVFIPLAYEKIGLFGVVIVIALNDIPLYLVTSYGLWKEKLTCIQQDLMATLLLLVAIAIIVASRYYLNFGSPLELLN